MCSTFTQIAVGLRFERLEPITDQRWRSTYYYVGWSQLSWMLTVIGYGRPIRVLCTN